MVAGALMKRTRDDDDAAEDDVERTSWSEEVSLRAALAGEPPPEPRVCRWTDSLDGRNVTRALFYPNEVHSVGGEPEAMKSWLLLFAAVQEIRRGHVVFIDMEANDRSIVDRLLLLGATPKQVRTRFHYYRPDARISEDDQHEFRSMVERWEPTLVVLDGVTEAYSMHGLSINAAEDAAFWFRNFSRQFQATPVDGYDGPAIVELDHVVKDKEGRGNWNIGTQHKKAGIKGAMYMVESVHPLAKGKRGTSRLFLAKDSPGGVAWVRSGKNRRLVGHFHVDAEDAERLDAWIESASPADEAASDGDDLAPADRPQFRQCMRAIWEFVAGTPEQSGKVIRAKVKGYGDKMKQDALAVLLADGHLVNEGTGHRPKYVVGTEFTLLGAVREEES